MVLEEKRLVWLVSALLDAVPLPHSFTEGAYSRTQFQSSGPVTVAEDLFEQILIRGPVSLSLRSGFDRLEEPLSDL